MSDAAVIGGEREVFRAQSRVSAASRIPKGEGLFRV